VIFALFVCVQYFAYGVEPRALVDDPRRGAKSAGREGLAGVGGVADRDRLSVTAEVDFVLADHVAHAHRVNADLPRRPLAGENLMEVLRHRAADLAAPIQMCDALSRNEPKGVATILANCNAHGRRQFVDVVESFPAECRFVLETLKDVYRNEALAGKRNLTPQQRLRFHQKQSGRLMGELKGWLNRQLRQRLVEPNSGLGQAIQYMLRHWKSLPSS
jgi:hypothetical protein